MRRYLSVLLLMVSFGSSSQADAGQMRWTLGASYLIVPVTLTEANGLVSYLNSNLSYMGSGGLEFQFGSAQTFFYLGSLIEYQSSTFDVALTPGVPATAINTIGIGTVAGFSFWKLRIGGYGRLQDLYILSHTEDFGYTRDPITILGATLDFNFLSRGDLDIILKSKYGIITADATVLSGTELGVGAYFEVGNSVRWTLGAGLLRKDLVTTAGVQSNQDIFFGLQFTLPFLLTVPNRSGGSSTSSSGPGSSSSRRY